MKKIINGKVYDTETAKRLGWYENTYNVRDFHYCCETLYRKKTGEYFLHGEGGPMSRYAEASGMNSWSSGERIMPMTYAEATRWAEENLDGDEYEEIFGAVIEDDTKKLVTYNLTVTSIEKLKRLSEMQGISASELLDQIIQQQ